MHDTRVPWPKFKSCNSQCWVSANCSEEELLWGGSTVGGKIRASAYKDSDRQDSIRQDSIHDKNYADENRDYVNEHREDDDFTGDRYLDPRAYAPRRKTPMHLSSGREDDDELNDRMPLFLEREVQQVEDDARLAELEADLREVIQQETQASYASQRYVTPDMYDEYEAPLVRRSSLPTFVIRAGLMMISAVGLVTALLFLQGAFRESGSQLSGNVSEAFAAAPAITRVKEEKALDQNALPREHTKVASAVDNFQINKNSVSAYPPIPPGNAPVPDRVTGANDVPRVIDKAELANLLTRGNELIAVGDIAAARLLLQRAADAREPRAALALAGTYDPAVLRNLKVLGINPDLVTARAWYEKAREYGSLDAQARLDRLSK
jgi:hypothetical protein